MLGRQALDSLRDRGVSNPDEFASLDAAVLTEELQRWDADPTAGPGALRMRLKAALRPSRVRSATSLLQREKEYAEGIVQFLSKRYPDLCDPNPHPAAIAAVTRVHFLQGKDVKCSEYDAPIRAAVELWEQRFGEEVAA